MNLTQRQLQIFTVTAATLNMSRAAERLHLSQPAFSRALQALESQIELPLFHRSTRRLALTADGERFLPLAQRLLDDMRQALDALQGRSEGLAGTVSLAVGAAFGSTVLPDAVQAFMKAHPAVRLQLVDDNSRGITERVVRGEVDLGVGSLVGPAQGVASSLLLSAPLGLLTNPAHHRLPLRPTVAHGLRLPLIKESEDTSIMQALRTPGSAWTEAMSQGVEVSSLAIQLALVRAGVGVALLSAMAASSTQAQGLQFVPLRPLLQRKVFLLRRRDRAQRPAVQALAEVLRAAVAQAPLHAAVSKAVAVP